MLRKPTLDWRDLAARASTLEERRAGAVVVLDNANDAVADARLARWRELAAGGNEERFQTLLAARGLDLAGARRLLGCAFLPPGAPLPAWTRPARGIAALAAADGARRRGAVDDDLAATLYAPALRFARERLRRRVGAAAWRQLSARAHRDLENFLLRRLSAAGAAAVELELQVHRSLTGSGPGTAARESSANAEARLRREWRRELFAAGGLAELFRLYPVLARLCAELVEQWVTCGAEFLRRLRRDRHRLRIEFFPSGSSRPLGPVRTLHPGAGDPHRGGRTVCLLTFRDGRRLVYKPRSVGVDRAWFQMLAWVNASGFPLSFQPVKVLPRAGGCGWMEFVPAAPRRDRAARERYGRRAGALLCLYYLLGGTDGHRENLVAAGDQPVLVDLETLGHPPPLNLRTAAEKRLAHSVLRTGLLPVRAARRPGEAGRPDYVMNGFNPSASSRDFQGSDLIAGFREMGAFLTSSSRRVRALAAWEQKIAQRRVRRVRRPTLLYADLLHRSLAAACLRDGVDRSLEFEALHGRGAARCDADPGSESILQEVSDLEQLDIPYLTASPLPRRPVTFFALTLTRRGEKSAAGLLAAHLTNQRVRLEAALRTAASQPRR